MNNTVKVMTFPKSDVVPTKETVDYKYIYEYRVADALMNFKSVLDGIDLNRKLDPNHVTEIYNEVMDIPYGINTHTFGGAYIAPIRVDINTYTCIDGNNTKAAFLRAWSEGATGRVRVIYEDVPREYLSYIMKIINNTQKPWKVQDFAVQAVNTGNKSVVSLSEFAESHPLCMKGVKNPQINICYAGAFIKGYRVTKDIKGETLSVTKKELEFAEQIYSEVDTMVNVLVNDMGWTKNNWLETFIYAWWDIRNSDILYNKVIKEVGFNTIAAHIKEHFNEMKVIPVSRKNHWEKVFRTLINTTQAKVDNKTWNKIA